MKKFTMEKLPACSFCGREAKYDAPTKMGSWAYMCESCFRIHASPRAREVGTELEKRIYKVVVPPEKIKTVMVPMTWDSIATVYCPYCGEGRDVEPDANYTVTCEGCGHKYRIRSMI